MSKSATLQNEQEMTDGMDEIELQRLQWQYRLMECDRKAYSEESRLQIFKQRATIATLKKDEAYLQAELKILTFTRKDRRHSAVAKKSETMTDASETLQFKIKAILNDIDI